MREIIDISEEEVNDIVNVFNALLELYLKARIAPSVWSLPVLLNFYSMLSMDQIESIKYLDHLAPQI